jgi:hypothetical protein
MSTGGGFEQRSVSSIFTPMIARGMDPQHTPEFQQMVAQGMDPDTPVHLLGWVDDFPARRDLAAQFAPPLAQVAPHLMGADQDVLLYKAWKEVLGAYPAYVAQKIGDCTSFGSSHCVDLLQCIEIFLLKEPTAFQEICTEFIYGAGREIAGMLGGGDGCYGVAVAKAFTTVGAVTRKLVGPYDGNRAKQWGSRGVPAEMKTAAAPFKVGSTALITTLDELDASLANLYPSAGGFSQGFTMHRDQDGCCQQSGRWGHEQCCAGRRTRNGRRQYLLCQSWGPNVPDGPLTDDQPDFSFWIDETAMGSILSQQDWLTFSKAPDFEKRPVPAKFRHSRMVA